MILYVPSLITAAMVDLLSFKIFIKKPNFSVSNIGEKEIPFVTKFGYLNLIFMLSLP